MRLLTAIGQKILFPLDYVNSRKWKPYSKIILKKENSSWVLDEIYQELSVFLNSIDKKLINERYLYNSKNQILYNLSKYDVLKNIHTYNHKVYFPYFHGRPENSEEFQLLISAIKKYHNKIAGIQVPNSLSENIILETGIQKNKVFKIPISIDLNKFKNINGIDKFFLRSNLEIPKNAFVIGSFQKDGQGWEGGNSPKMIKGPDILLKSLAKLKYEIKNLFILLVGPSRGYVIQGLKNLKIPFKHIILNNHYDIYKYYKILDLYMITSREEGGPRALLESMICSIPVVTTNVGMAHDLVKHNFHGWKVDSEDVEGLIFWSKHVYKKPNDLELIIKNGYALAKNNSYQFQKKLWENFLKI
jgi:glycosyltransferase involved in cell wall biosynthesis